MAEVATTFTVNINDDAYVRLTPAGIERLQQFYVDLRFGKDAPTLHELKRTHEQPSGEWRFQLHELFRVFGPSCYVGSYPPSFENNVIRFGPES